MEMLITVVHYNYSGLSHSLVPCQGLYHIVQTLNTQVVILMEITKFYLLGEH